MEFSPFLIIVIGILITGLALIKPLIGLVLIIFFISVARFPTVLPSFLGIFTNLSVVKLLGGITFVSVLIHGMVGKKKMRIFETKEARFFIFYLIWVVISGFTQPSSFTRETFTKYASFAMLFYITLYLVDSPKNFRIVLWSCIISMLAAAGLAVFQHFSAEDVIRARSAFIDSNYFNFYLLPIIPVAFYRMFDENSFFKKIIAAVTVVILILAVIFTYSRGGMIGLVVIFLLLALNSRRKLLSFLVIAILAGLFITYMPDYLQDRIETTGLELQEENPASSTYRRLLLSKAGLMMLRDNPIMGVGVGNFYWSVRNYVPASAGFAHNMYVEVAAETGLVGIFLFMGMIFFTLKDLRKIIKNASPHLKSYGLGLYVGLMGFLVSAIFLHAEYEKFLWLFIFLTICLKKLAAESEEVVI